MSAVATCLWFNGQAEEAATFYVSLFPDGRITAVSRYGVGAPFPEGTALMMQFSLAGQHFQALNGGPQYSHSEAISISIGVKNAAEVDHFWDALVADGGQEGRCGWLKDRFGVSSQIVQEFYVTVTRKLSRPLPPVVAGSRAPVSAMKLTSGFTTEICCTRRLVAMSYTQTSVPGSLCVSGPPWCIST